MSRMSRTAKLIVAARKAARGGTVQDRAAGLAEVKDAALPEQYSVGVAKYSVAATLKQAALGLEFAADEAWSRQADEVIEMANKLTRMKDIPCTEREIQERRRFHWLKED